MKALPVIIYTFQHPKEVRNYHPSNKTTSVFSIKHKQNTSLCVISCCLFACSTICSQVLQDSAATSGQHLRGLGRASGTQRCHYRIFPQVPNGYADPISETLSNISGDLRAELSKHNIVSCGPLSAKTAKL